MQRWIHQAHFIIYLALFGVAVPLNHASGQADLLHRTPARQSFYVGQPVTLTFSAGTEWPAAAEHLLLRLEYAGRTLLRRQVAARFPATVDFEFPGLKPTAVAATNLTVTAVSAAGNQLAQRSEQLWFVAERQAAMYQQALRDLQIGLFAPGNRQLPLLLEELEIPYTAVAQPAQFSGKWLVVADVDFSRMPGLMTTFVDLAGNGCNVLIVPPFAGAVAFPELRNRELVLAGTEKIRALGKYLDPLPAQSYCRPVSLGDGSVALEFGPEVDAGSSFVQLKLDRGQVLLCGWDLSQYATNPTVALLLLYLFGVRASQ